MGKYTPEELNRMAPGRSPEELENLNMDDGEFARRGAELLAAHSQSMHEIEIIKNEGLHALNTLRFDGEIRAGARAIFDKDPAGPSIEAIIEKVIIPIRQAYLAGFEIDTAPVARHKAGANEAAFLKLTGGSDD